MAYRLRARIFRNYILVADCRVPNPNPAFIPVAVCLFIKCLVFAYETCSAFFVIFHMANRTVIQVHTNTIVVRTFKAIGQF